ncbi:MAG: hypothetical protein WBB53_05175, partial [Ferruginibacter sp.]
EKNVQHFFKKLLQSRSEDIQMEAALLMIKNHKKVADSILLQLASKDKFRAGLYNRLALLGWLDYFPQTYLNQEMIARSFMVAKSTANKLDSVVFLSKQPCTFRNKSGMVYFYKYRVNKSGDWKIGLSGIQPINENEIDNYNWLTQLTGKTIKENEPVEKQLSRQLLQKLFSLRKSSAEFFMDDGYYNYDRER